MKKKIHEKLNIFLFTDRTYLRDTDQEDANSFLPLDVSLTNQQLNIPYWNLIDSFINRQCMHFCSSIYSIDYHSIGCEFIFNYLWFTACGRWLQGNSCHNRLASQILGNFIEYSIILHFQSSWKNPIVWRSIRWWHLWWNR